MVLRLTTVAILLGTFAFASAAPTGAAAKPASRFQPTPTMRLVATQGYTLSVEGANWPKSARITFTLVQGYPAEGLELRATARGRFLVGINNIDICNGETMIARDFVGDRIAIPGPAVACPSNPHPPTPMLTVLKDKQLPFKSTHIDVPHRGQTVVIRLADAIYLWEAGTTGPGFVPAAPAAYFELLARGRTPPRACPEVECAAGFFWEWAGMKVGHTGIAMNPHCYPKCEIASYLIPVTIEPRKQAGMYARRLRSRDHQFSRTGSYGGVNYHGRGDHAVARNSPQSSAHAIRRKLFSRVIHAHLFRITRVVGASRRRRAPVRGTVAPLAQACGLSRYVAWRPGLGA